MTFRRSRLPFPGDHPDKTAARLFLYKHAIDAPRHGHAVTLAGTEPRSEITLLRDYLQWDASRTWFVDHDVDNPHVRHAIKAIRFLWHGVNAKFCTLQTLLPKLDMIGFANLDFMGHLTESNVLPCLRETSQRLLPGGIIGLTWERGREQLGVAKHSGARAVREGSKPNRSLNSKRWAGVLKIVQEETEGRLSFVAGLEYQNNHSPMSVTVFRKL